jgi:hypothetical protein
MVTLSDLWNIIPVLSVVVALIYYAATLRSVEKTRRRDLINQRLQVASLDYYRILQDVRMMVDWETPEEFYSKYHYAVNPQAYSKIEYLLNLYSSVGILQRDGIISLEEVFQLYPPYTTIGIWEQFKPYIERARLTMNDPNWLEPYEQLYIKARKMYPNTSNMKQTTLKRIKERQGP